MANLNPFFTAARGHWINIRHHANTQAFIKAFWPAFGQACGWAFPALIVGALIL